MPKWPDRFAYSPIINRRAGRWPNGAGLAVYFAIGVEHYRFNEGITEDLLPEASKPDLVNSSWREYGNRVGVFRLLECFHEAGVSPALMVNSDLYKSCPDVFAYARKCNAEIVAHGQSNSDSLALMTPDQQVDYIETTLATIAAQEGQRPRGWSSPWLAHTDETLDLLQEAGISYVLDFHLDDQPTWLNTRLGKILAMPYGLELNDSTTVIGRRASARDFSDMILDEFEELLRASRDQPLVMSVVLHSFISGQPFRLNALRKALQRIFSEPSAWIATPGEIATAWARVQEDDF